MSKIMFNYSDIDNMLSAIEKHLRREYGIDEDSYYISDNRAVIIELVEEG